MSPDGRHAYVTNTSRIPPENVTQFKIGTGGRLSRMNPFFVPAGCGPAGISMRRRGANPYVTNLCSGNISQYGVGTDGKLTDGRPARVKAGTYPFDVATNPPAVP